MPAPLDIGSRRELMVDDFLVAALSGEVGHRLHQPIPQNVILTTDRVWEGNMNNFNTIIHEPDHLRLYYRGWQIPVEKNLAEGTGLKADHEPNICLATSTDGIHWERAKLGHIPYEGAPDNSIVWEGNGWHGFSPFKDPNPDTPPDQRYKAIGVDDTYKGKGRALLAFASADGIHWRQLREEPIMEHHLFDSHNVVFWDDLRGVYRAYWRDRRYADKPFRDTENVRDIRTATSPDFLSWQIEDAPLLTYTGDEQPVQLYSNNVLPYYRAPHLFVGLPARYIERSGWTPTMDQLPEREHRRLRADLGERYGTATSDAALMTSRDGVTFRRWGEAFIRPGLRAEGSWAYGDIYPVWGMVETASPLPGGGKELSIFANEGGWRGEGNQMRRYTLRIDGFVSVNASRRGGELLTRPLTFAGERLSLNISTSAVGGARVEVQDADGWPIEGYTLKDCWEIVGDTLDYTVTWKHGSDLSALQGKPVRLRIQLADADLYALQTVPAN